MTVVAGYEDLAAVLDAALRQAAEGKGAERHGGGRAFAAQPMLLIAAMVGPGFPLGQAMKKCQEAQRFVECGEAGRAEAELLGAINYLAGAVIAIRRAG